jgi:hypothetical protein
MAIAHRAFSTAGASLGSTFPKAGPALHQDADPIEFRRLGANGSVTCLPWEGLYLEEDGPAERAFDDSVEISTELDRFLSSIMYGE